MGKVRGEELVVGNESHCVLSGKGICSTANEKERPCQYQKSDMSFKNFHKILLPVNLITETGKNEEVSMQIRLRKKSFGRKFLDKLKSTIYCT